MKYLALAFTPRYVILTLCFVLTVALVVAIGGSMFSRWDYPLGLAAILFCALTLLGIHDIFQTRHAVLRNYPISAHLRFLLEEVRPEIRQYFFESENDGLPFSRSQRAIVYQRAKMALDKRPFGTQLDVYSQGYEWLRHSIAPKPVATDHFRVTVGGPDCRQPYSASIFNTPRPPRTSRKMSSTSDAFTPGSSVFASPSSTLDELHHDHFIQGGGNGM